jgi:hypothetical protein
MYDSRFYTKEAKDQQKFHQQYIAEEFAKVQAKY